jgi:uncharacterized protein YjiS (DUF1127 family)
MPKAIMPESFYRHRELSAFSDECWAKIKSQLPKPLPVAADTRLRGDIADCCSWFLTQRMHLREGQASAAAMRRPGKRQLAPLERWAKGLGTAADAWREMAEIENEVGQVRDDRLGDIGLSKHLEVMARDAERRLKGFRKLGKSIVVPDPFPEFVRRVAQCLSKVEVEPKLVPTATGSVYEAGKPSWFQNFIATLQAELLGRDGKQTNPQALAAEIAKALLSYKKSGKARKEII